MQNILHDYTYSNISRKNTLFSKESLGYSRKYILGKITLYSRSAFWQTNKLTNMNEKITPIEYKYLQTTYILSDGYLRQ